MDKIISVEQQVDKIKKEFSEQFTGAYERDIWDFLEPKIRLLCSEKDFYKKLIKANERTAGNQ